MAQRVADESGPATTMLTFLIADVRGYTRFTRERGDAAAAILAKRFADLARDAVEARSGRVIELRGDEALAVFDVPGQAVRAAVELQATFAEESEADTAFPFPVGMGIDRGEAAVVEEGYRGSALNMAARLCSSAGAGQVLVTQGVVASAENVDPDIRFEDRGPASFKGYDQAVTVLEAIRHDESVRPFEPAPAVADGGLPPELDPLTPLVARDHQMRWLRGTWRQVRRGRGRLLFVSGPAQIGKTRLAGELAAYVHAGGGAIRYAGPGGAATATALAEIRAVADSSAPSLLVLDDVDVAGPAVARELLGAFETLARRPVLVLSLLRDPAAAPDLSALIERADERGDGHRALEPLDLEGVRGIVRLYAGEDAADVPVESIARASHGVPGRVHEVVSDWARSEATRRLTAAAEFLAAGRDRHASDLEFANNVIGLKLGRLYTVEGRDVLAVETCPYKGLAAFDEEDSGSFFGRERLVGELAARTVQVGMLGVIGVSGSGKSSVIAAGLLPSLRAGLLPGSETWSQASIRPGEHPMDELRAALGNDADDPVAAFVAGAPAGGRLVLVIDQFEEAFTVCTSDVERTAFVDAVTGAAKRWPDRVAVVVAIRADHYGLCASYPDLADALAANHVLVGPLSRDELRRAIELPARRAGLRVETVLVDALVEEVADEPGGLPLLSTALVELWQAREDGWLRLETFERTGGVRGAVSRLAESSFAQLSEQEQDAARRVFLRLVATGEGEALTRRRVPLDEFDLAQDAAAAAVVARLTQDRLLTLGEDSVEVAHEALLREWPRLQGWLEEDSQGRQLRQHLTQASRHWQDRGQEASELYRGARLSATLDWSAGHAQDLNELEREFLSASRQASEREAERQRRTNRRLRGLLAGVAVFLVVALVAGGLALVQQRNASNSRNRAVKVARVSLASSLGAQSVIDPQLDQAMLLARESVNLSNDVQTRNFLLTTLERSPLAIGVLHPQADVRPVDISLSPDGRTLAIDENIGDVEFRHVSTGSVAARPLPGNWARVAYTPDGATLVTVRADDHGLVRSLDFYDAESHALVRSVTVPSAMTNTAFSVALSFSPDGRTLLAGSDSAPPATGGPPKSMGYVVRVDVATGRRSGPVLTVPGGVAAMAYSPDGSRFIVVGQKTRVFVTRTSRVETVRPFGNPEGPSAAVSPNGRYVAAQSQAGDLQVLDLRSGSVSTLASGLPGIVPFLFTPDSTTLVTGEENDQVQVWDVASHSLRQTLTGHAGPVHQLAISADGSTLYSGSLDGTVFEWDLSGNRSFGRSAQVSSGDNGNFGSDPNVAITPDGRILATGETNGDVVLADAATLHPIMSFHAMDLQIASVSFSADGHQLAVAGGLFVGPNAGYPVRGKLQVWQLGAQPGIRPTLVRTLRGVDSLVWASYTSDGRHIIGVGGDNVDSANGPSSAARVAEWDARSGALVGAPMKLPSVAGLGLASNPDGSRVLVGLAAGQAALVDPAHGKVIKMLPVGGGAVFGVAMSPDGRELATGDGDGFVQLWNAATGRRIGVDMKSVSGLVVGLQFTADGQTLLATGGDGTVRMWDEATQRAIGNPFPTQDQNWAYGVISPDRSTFVVAYSDGQVYEWPVTLRSWEGHACAVARRSFTKAEWSQFVGSQYPHPTLCG